MPNNFSSKNSKSKALNALNQLLKEAQIYARVTGQEEVCPEEKLKKLYKTTSGCEKSGSRKGSGGSQEEISEDEDGFRFKSPSVDCEDVEIDDFF